MAVVDHPGDSFKGIAGIMACDIIEAEGHEEIGSGDTEAGTKEMNAAGGVDSRAKRRGYDGGVFAT